MSETVAIEKAQRFYNLVRELIGDDHTGSNQTRGDIKYVMTIAITDNSYQLMQVGVRDGAAILTILKDVARKVLMESIGIE